MKKVMILLSVLVAAILVSGCGDLKPKKLIPDSDMKKISAELLPAMASEAINPNNANRSNAEVAQRLKERYDPILSKYGYTFEDYVYTQEQMQKNLMKAFDNIGK